MRLETDNLILHFDSFEEVSLTVDAIINPHLLIRGRNYLFEVQRQFGGWLRKSCHLT